MSSAGERLARQIPLNSWLRFGEDPAARSGISVRREGEAPAEPLLAKESVKAARQEPRPPNLPTSINARWIAPENVVLGFRFDLREQLESAFGEMIRDHLNPLCFA